MNRSVHSSEALPKFTLPVGIKEESNLPVAVIVSDVASPKSTLPLTVKLPATSKSELKSTAPLIVVIPDIATLPLAKIVAPIPRVPPKFA